MTWSTREVARLAGTTLRAVRHYHDVGLLPEPRRRSNGYKEYGVAHLVRLVRIKRLTDLGFSLSRIAAMTESDDHPVEALRALDAELAGTIDRLHRARLELAVLLRQATPAELPPGLADPETLVRMSPADRSFVVVLNQLLGAETMQAWAGVLRDGIGDPCAEDFDTLAPDADEASREAVARGLVPHVQRLHADHPQLRTVAGSRYGPRYVQQALGTALRELYNPAQLDVLRRLGRLLAEAPQD